MGLLENISMFVEEEEIEDKEKVETSQESMSAENFDKFMKGKNDIFNTRLVRYFSRRKR